MHDSLNITKLYFILLKNFCDKCYFIISVFLSYREVFTQSLLLKSIYLNYVHRIAFSVKVSRLTVQKLDKQIGSEKIYQCDTFQSLSDINLLASCFDVVANTFTSVFLYLI